MREILNQIVDQDFLFEDLNGQIKDQIAALRYAAYYFRGKYKAMYQEAKQMKGALEHSEKRSADNQEKNLVNDVVTLYLKKEAFQRKLIFSVISSCPVPYHSKCGGSGMQKS